MLTFKLETLNFIDQNILIIDLLNLREPLNFLLYFKIFIAQFYCESCSAQNFLSNGIWYDHIWTLRIFTL